ncbi:hypothetical protein DSAG12_02698 [Promethearchaeum syntrophicum]|uniref:Uncharacterized protein n=1 Tax=Promethearchaeum syntrophicum TaxID=2594042 RepID=A0A5B9DCC6_9ARCH|nr:hypothetical protein [Candidatus Prometheoarchaeum syntrophicum]
MTEQIIQIIILVPAAILSLIAGIFLVVRGKDKLDKGMIILGISYILMICFFIVWGFNLAVQLIDYTIMYAVYMGMNFFTKFTFHENKKSSFKSIVIFTTVNYIILIIPKILLLLNQYDDIILSRTGKILDNTFSITWAIIVFGWLAYSGLESFHQIKDKKVQPWIKKRLLLVIYSAFFEMFVSLPDLLDILTNRILHDYVFYIQMIMIATIMVMQFLAWVMPKKLKNFLNRGYIVENKADVGITEEEIINQMLEGDQN